MIHLIIASIFWAFSFGLIKTQLAGVSPALIALIRTTIGALMFLPFLRLKGLRLQSILYLLSIGSIQYGVCYYLYLNSFQYLQAYQIALFLTFTPIYVTLLHDFLHKNFILKNFIAAIIAVIGAACIYHKGDYWNTVLIGFLLLQFADFAFAWGQVYYKKLRSTELKHFKDLHIFGLTHLGAVIVSAIMTYFTGGLTNIHALTTHQWMTLAYLGVCSTGLAYYFWNKGAVTTDSGLLAVMNNLKVPLGILISLIIFKETADLTRLMISCGLLFFAFWLSLTPLRSTVTVTKKQNNTL